MLKTDHNLLSFSFPFSFLFSLVGGVACVMPSESFQAHNDGYDPPIPDHLLISALLREIFPQTKQKAPLGSNQVKFVLGP